MDPNPLHSVLDHLTVLIRERLQAHFNGQKVVHVPLPDWKEPQHPLQHFCREHQLQPEEVQTLLIALAPHLVPDYYDRTFRKFLPEAGDFPQMGGVRGQKFRAFLPTGETVVFLLGGDRDLHRRFEVQRLFDPDHLFARRRILWLDDIAAGEPRMSGKLILSPEYIDLFTMGKPSRPRFSLQFPAERIETLMEKEDLIIHDETRRQLEDIEIWIRHGQALREDWGMRKRVKPGFRALFYGPPGTGKTLAATLLGKFTGKDVYRVDISMVVSKYIGETEKNLANLFAKAEHKDWILFFDEADALFGKRTNVKDAHDKYANQEVAYLLQRVENYDGLVILATNFRSNLDDAFIRRFQAIVPFPMPGPQQRRQLWERALPAEAVLSPQIELARLARQYEISGADIVNILQFAGLRALDRAADQLHIQLADIEEGIAREYQKLGKINR